MRRLQATSSPRNGCLYQATKCLTHALGPRHAVAWPRHPRLCRCTRKKDVDADLRRHDDQPPPMGQSFRGLVLLGARPKWPGKARRQQLGEGIGETLRDDDYRLRLLRRHDRLGADTVIRRLLVFVGSPEQRSGLRSTRGSVFATWANIVRMPLWLLTAPPCSQTRRHGPRGRQRDTPLSLPLTAEESR